MRHLFLGFTTLSALATICPADPAPDLPGARRAIALDIKNDLFVDQNFSAPTPSLANPPITEAEVRSRTFTANAQALVVTSIVLTNDPDYRAASLNKFPVRIGTKLPMELFPASPGGDVIVRRIEHDMIELQLMDGGENPSYALKYSFKTARRSTKKQ